MDTLTKAQRRKTMQAIKSKDTKIEVRLAKILYARGHRYRKHDKSVFGTPDLVFKKYNTVVFVDGEFWHGKNWLQRKQKDIDNKDFWVKKIERNIERDKNVNAVLTSQGWKVLRFWGNEIKNNLLEVVLLVENTLKDSDFTANEKIYLENLENHYFKVRLLESTGQLPEINTKQLTQISPLINQRKIYTLPDEQSIHLAGEGSTQYNPPQTKIAPFPSPEPPLFTFIELYAGLGGFRLALQPLGGGCVFSYEPNMEARIAYQRNFGMLPDASFSEKDIQKQIPEDADLLCAIFPCHAFAVKGKKGSLEDSKGTRFYELATLIKEKSPKSILLETDKILPTQDKGKTMKTILHILEVECAYFISQPQIFNALDFGLPHYRERAFIVGFKKSLGISEFHFPKNKEGHAPISSLLEKKLVPSKYYLKKKDVDHILQSIEENTLPTKSKLNLLQEGGIAKSIKGKYNNLVWDYAWLAGKMRKGIRRLTPRECARFQGFPDSFVLPENDSPAYQQIANSTTIPIIQAIAHLMLDCLKLLPNKQK